MTPSAYRDHPIRPLLDQLLLLRVHDGMSGDSVAGNEQIAAARDTVFAMSETIKELLEKTPASRVSLHALNSMQKYIAAAHNEVAAFTSNGNVNHLVNAANQYEQNVVQWLWGFTPTVRGRESARLREEIEALSQSSMSAVQQISAARDGLISRFAEVESSADELKKKVDELRESAAAERAQAAATVSSLQQSFNTKEIDRDNTFNAAVAEVKEQAVEQRDAAADKADQAIAQLQGAGDALVASLTEQSAAIIAGLQAQRDEAAKIVQVVGNIGVTGNYQRIANDEQRQANNWRRFTVLLFLAGVTLAVATFIKHFGEPIDSSNAGSIAIRLLYALVIASPAWYTARESARHRTNADRARQTELELASLGPFIELLPQAKKDEIREKMTDLYFGKEVAPHEAQSPVDIESLKKFVVDVAKAIRSN